MDRGRFIEVTLDPILIRFVLISFEQTYESNVVVQIKLRQVSKILIRNKYEYRENLADYDQSIKLH